MAAVCVFVLLFLSISYEPTEAAEELTAEVVLDVLTRRLDYVTQEINTVKNGMAEIKLDVSKIEERIEKIETNVSNMIINLEDQKEADISKSDVTATCKRQSKVLQKMLVTEKVFLRRTVDEFSNMFNGFKSDINSHLLLINISVGNSIENLEQVVTDHKSDTNTSLLEMKFGLQTMMNETDNRVEEIGQEMKEMASESLEKINEVGESIKTKTKFDMDSAKQVFGSQLNSEISVVTTKLKALEREQDRQEDDFDDRISDVDRRISNEESYTRGLSRRIFAEEERKVAFSARKTKTAYYGKSQRIVFDSVIYSHGGGYDSSTGIFAAPKSGTYLFSYNIESSSSGKAHVTLHVRGYIKTRALVAKGIDNTGGNVGVEYLNKGDKAWVQTAPLQDRYYISRYRTTFNGILID